MAWGVQGGPGRRVAGDLIPFVNNPIHGERYLSRRMRMRQHRRSGAFSKVRGSADVIAVVVGQEDRFNRPAR